MEMTVYMEKITVKIDGMMCTMCESHICETIRKAFPEASKVSASHTKNIATFVTDSSVDEQKLVDAINATGYTFISATSEPYSGKKGLFGLFK